MENVNLLYFSEHPEYMFCWKKSTWLSMLSYINFAGTMFYRELHSDIELRWKQ